MQSVEVRHARLLRPFPVKRLCEGMYHVQAEANAINTRLMALLIEPPVTPEMWTWELQMLSNSLETLVERCEAAMPMLDEMSRSAHGDFRRAVEAMSAILKGMVPDPVSAAEEAPSEVTA